MTPEQQARGSIDALLIAAGWHICNVQDANIHASTGVAIREFPLNTGFGFADYLLYVNGKALQMKSTAICPSSVKSEARSTPTSSARRR